MKYGVLEQRSQEVLKEGFKIILLNKCHICSAVPQLEAEDGGDCAQLSLRNTQVLRHSTQAIRQAEDIKLSGITNMSITIVLMDR